MTTKKQTWEVERVQTGVRIEKRILKVLKALAEYHEITLGDLLEGIVLHAFEGKAPFGADNLARIVELKKIYHLDLDAAASHRLIEKAAPRFRAKQAPEARAAARGMRSRPSPKEPR